MCLAAVLAAALVSTDPWAPGASLEPWPLISTLQAHAPGANTEPPWARAVAHEDWRVRAAAAAALGRVPGPAAKQWLDVLRRDRLRDVRYVAQWAALRQPGEPTRRLVEEIAFEHSSHHGLLHGLAPEGALATPGARRRWVDSLPAEGVLPRAAAETPWEAAARVIGVSLARSEWNEDEIVEILVIVASGPGKMSGKLRLSAAAVPDDPPPFLAPRPRPDSRDGEPPKGQPLTLRPVGGDGGPEVVVPPNTARAVRVAFDVAGLLPDVYRIDLVHPVFIRVRRGARDETRVQAAVADVLRSEEALESASRLRVRAAAAPLERRFQESLAKYGYGFNTWRDTLVLARVGGARAAALVVPPLLGAQDFDDPFTSRDPDLHQLFTRGFAGAARARVDAFARDWQGALARGFDEALADILRDPAWASGTAVDAARLEILRASAPAQADYRRGSVLAAAVQSAQRDHPEEVAAHVATSAAGGKLHAQQVAVLGVGEPVPVRARLLTALWRALPPEAAEARAAVAAEAETLALALPGAGAGPVPPAEALRQLRQSLASYIAEDLEPVLARARAALEAQPTPELALVLTQALVRAGRFGEAARVLPDPAILRPELLGGRRTALALRGLIAASEGRLKDAARDLAAGDKTEAAEEVARRLAVIGDPPGASVRFLRGLLPHGEIREIFGRSVFWVGDGELRRFDVPEMRGFVIGRLTAAARVWKAVGMESVVVAGTDRVWRLDAGRPKPTWTEVMPATREGGSLTIDATTEVTAALADEALHVWSTADPARGRWSAYNVQRFSILGGDLLVVAVEGRCSYLKRIDGRAGTPRWIINLGEGSVRLLSHDGALAVLWDSQSGLTAWEAASGRRRWARKLESVNTGRANNNRADVLVAGARVYVRAGDTLHGLAAEDGRTEWSLPFAQRPDETPDSGSGSSAGSLRRRPDGSVWWFGELRTPAMQTAVRLVTPDGQVKLVPASNGERMGRLTFLDDGSFLMPPRYGNWVEWWAPR